MPIEYKFPNFNAQSQRLKKTKNDFISIILNSKNKYKLLNNYLEDTTKFCKENYNYLIDNIVREQRYLVFETPNRVKIKHEYTVNNTFTKSEYLYLFNPKDRLDWLKIFIEDERVSIAHKSYVLDKIEEILKDEIQLFLDANKDYDKEEVLNKLYENGTGLPCFIEFNANDKYKKQLSLFVIVEYYNTPHFEKKGKSELFHPINKRSYEYSYYPLSKNASSWLYLKSPKNFILFNKDKEINNKDIDYPNSEDPEISTAVIKNGKCIKFKYIIDVPFSLKVWFKTILYSSFSYIIFILIILLDKINFASEHRILRKFAIFNDYFVSISSNLILSISLALVAGIIATRGWLIIEETILKKISILLTIEMIILMLGSICFYLL